MFKEKRIISRGLASEMLGFLRIIGVSGVLGVLKGGIRGVTGIPGEGSAWRRGHPSARLNSYVR